MEQRFAGGEGIIRAHNAVIVIHADKVQHADVIIVDAEAVKNGVVIGLHGVTAHQSGNGGVTVFLHIFRRKLMGSEHLLVGMADIFQLLIRQVV